MCLSASSAVSLSVWLSGLLFLSCCLKLTGYQSGHPSFSPFCLPPHTPHLVSPSVCLYVRNERNLQQKQQLAGGPMSHDALHRARCAPDAPHLAFYCVRARSHTFNLYRLVIAWTMTATDVSIHYRILERGGVGGLRGGTDRCPWYADGNHIWRFFTHIFKNLLIIHELDQLIFSVWC